MSPQRLIIKSLSSALRSFSYSLSKRYAHEVGRLTINHMR